MALIKEYFELTKKYQEDYGDKIILLMQVGSFFEVYGLVDKKTNSITGSLITDFSRICDLSVVAKNVCVGTSDICMAGFKDIGIERYIKKIQEAGYTSVVYTQDQAAKNTTRSLAGIFSPGTYFSNDSRSLTNNITCVWIDLIENKFLLKGKYVSVGVANIDIYTGKTSIFQFKEIYVNNPSTYDELERFLSIYNPSEIIFISNLNEIEINDIINYTNIQCGLIHKINLNNSTTQFTLRAKNCVKQIYQKEILQKFYKMEDFDNFIQNFYDNEIATQSFCFLLDFVYTHNPNLVNQISEPVFENCSNRLILANHSLKQLNIIDDPLKDYNGKYSSVLKMLNCCLTPMGSRKFAYNFLNPTTDTNYLEEEYNITDYLISKKEDDFIKNKLSSIKDLSKWQRQVFLKKISPKSFYNLYKNIVSIKDIYENINTDVILLKYLNIRDPSLDNINDFCKNILTFIDDNIDIELCKEIEQLQNFENNFIRYGIDKDLDTKSEIIKESEDKLEAIRQYLGRLIENGEKKNKSPNDFVKIHETEKNHFSLLCTKRRCKLLETSLPEISTNVVLKYTSTYNKLETEFVFNISKNEFVFNKQSIMSNFIINPEISKLCKKISTLKVSLKDTLALVFNKFVAKFGSCQKQMECVISFVTLLDIVYSKACIAKKYNYCKPKIAEAKKSFINAKGLRHCLIEHLQTNELYITNDISIGDGKIDGILLYGTNAVGKTSIIRALGIATIMAQSGLYVPCSEFVFKPYKYIFTRIIGNDNIFKGLSTFAVEMLELRTILRLADDCSLILGDELCSGTENTSAVSIFVAGIQKIQKVNSSFIFATHLHEIVNYEEITNLNNVVLKHLTVVYDKERDILVYDRKLKDGAGNSMYGLEVCKSLNLPEDFLNNAYNIRLKYNPEMDSLLSLKTSHFNSKNIMNLCEICKINLGSEVHHLQHQNNADDNGIINGLFHKNNPANLMTLCEKCHNEFHKTNVQHKKVKTSKGYELQEI